MTNEWDNADFFPRQYTKSKWSDRGLLGVLCIIVALVTCYGVIFIMFNTHMVGNKQNCSSSVFEGNIEGKDWYSENDAECDMWP